MVPRSTVSLHDWVGRVPDLELLDRRTRQNATLARVFGGPLGRLARATEKPLGVQVGGIFRRFDVVSKLAFAPPDLPIEVRVRFDAARRVPSSGT